MSCLNGVYAQIVTFLSVPHEILSLQHKVFREYAKVAVGPDFIHTLPSFLILTAISLVLWKHPPNSKWLFRNMGSASMYKIFQIATAWVVISMVFWSWLIFQRILYCLVWAYWSYESEYRDVVYPWWQRVWSLYYPLPIQPPILSAGFISWIISMLVAVSTLGCAISTSRVQAFIDDSLSVLQDFFTVIKYYIDYITKKLVSYWIREMTLPYEGDKSSCEGADGSDISSLGEDYRSEISSDIKQPTTKRHQVHPICYGTNWTPKPNFSGYGKEVQRKTSMKSVHTVTGATETHHGEKFSASRHKYGCHTVIPSNSSDKSSEC